MQLLGKAPDPNSGGRQMYGHFGSRSLHIVQGSSCVANQLPHAVGVALASKMRREDSATITFFGEGGSSEGDFHVALNFAGVQRAPVVFVCENNRYAISVPAPLQMAVEYVADRAYAYGFEGVVVDGNDVLEVYAVTREAMEKARAGGGPTLVEATTYRTSAHSTTDDDRRYRSPEEVAAWKARDPVLLFTSYCREHDLITEQGLEDMKSELLTEIEAAMSAADAAPEPEPSELVRNVYAEHV
jgi:2-oxoisovalerate dehydrogenase E1 component alpha subunit